MIDYSIFKEWGRWDSNPVVLSATGLQSVSVALPSTSPYVSAGDQIRTGRLFHGKEALYQMSYTRIPAFKSCPREESNLQPAAYDAAAPIELPGRTAVGN